MRIISYQYFSSLVLALLPNTSSQFTLLRIIALSLQGADFTVLDPHPEGPNVLRYESQINQIICHCDMINLQRICLNFV